MKENDFYLTAHVSESSHGQGGITAGVISGPPICRSVEEILVRPVSTTNFRVLNHSDCVFCTVIGVTAVGGNLLWTKK